MSEHVDMRPGDRILLLQPGSSAYVDLVITRPSGKVRRTELGASEPS